MKKNFFLYVFVSIKIISHHGIVHIYMLGLRLVAAPPLGQVAE